MRVVPALLVACWAAGAAGEAAGAGCGKGGSCDECAAIAGCVWCPAERHSETFRCTNRLGSHCSESVINADVPPKHQTKLTRNDAFGERRDKKVIQLRPQDITITARPGQTVTFDMHYKPAKDYPLDLYYLIDYSYSMKPFITTMRTQGQHIYDDLKKLTNNVHMGIGSFIEKPALPYSSKYKKTYSFKNLMKLQEVDSTIDFMDVLNRTEMRGNFDNPEAGLDALLQVMVCQRQLQWRNDTTRLIILTTDDMYHSAGDGKMAGAYLRHDGGCHADENGDYSLDKSLLFDYPSVPLINYVAKTNYFRIIFVVADRVMPEYDALAAYVNGAATRVMTSDGDDVVELISNIYKSVTNKFKIDKTGVPKHLVDLVFDPDCENDSKGCGVENRNKLTVKARLTVRSCPSKDDREHTFTINPQGYSDTLTVRLKIVCDCSAFNSSHPPVPDAKSCNLHGTYQYGTCKCNNGWTGEHCECDASRGEMTQDERRSCVHGDGATVECSDRGRCVCSQCKCQPRYIGRYCECDTEAAECMPRAGGPACSGHGSCNCSRQCECVAPYRGQYCTEKCDPNKCMHALSDQACSGNGDCDCNRCSCRDDATGHHCEQGGRGDFQRATCELLHACVLCHRDVGGPCAGACYLSARNVSVGTVVFKNSEQMRALTGWSECRTLKIGAACHVLFKFRGGDVAVQDEPDCTEQQNILLTALGVVLAVVVLGLLTLLAWKLLTTLHDRREYARFMKDTQDAAWGTAVNPMYSPATTTFRNPAYDE